MGFVGMGWQEITIIVIAAIIIFGPNRLPEIAGQAARALRDLRKMTQDLTGEFERETGVNVRDLKSTVDKEIASVKAEMTSVQNSVTKEVNSAKSTVSSTASKATKSVNSSISSKSGSKASSTTAKSTSTTKTKSGSTVSAARSTKAKEKVVAVPKASKADPLADVSFFEDSDLQTSTRSVKSNGGTSTKAVANGSAESTSPPKSNGAASDSTLDAVSRTRSRRIGAGYNKQAS
jgi:sec-independent protein translocase protein TatB